MLYFSCCALQFVVNMKLKIVISVIPAWLLFWHNLYS